MAKRRKKDEVKLEESFEHRPLAGLAGLRANLPGADAAPVPSAPATDNPAGGQPAEDVHAVVVRRERKGHGGKTVTRITGWEEQGLDSLAKELKKKLGCGASREGGDILVQGDHVGRVAALLRERGVPRVVEGN